MDFEVRHVDGTTVKLISSEHKCAITSATQTRKLCGNDTVTINLQSATYIEFQVGDKITIFGTTYTMNQLPTVKKESERSYTYTLVFEGLQYTLIDRVFLMPANTQGDNLMFDLAGMLRELATNINRGNSGKQYEFVLDESLEETEYKNLSLTGKNCLQVLQQLCQEWNTEFVFAEEPSRIAIYIGVAGSTFAFPFTYGRGGGVYELNREKGASDICTRLFVYGGTQNLTYYRHNRLCLPLKEKNQSFVEDATAQAVYGIKEQVKNFDDIYPNRIGKITSLSGCDYNEFIDSAMADPDYGFDLNEKWANNADDCEEWLALKGLEDTAANRAIYQNDVAGTATKYLMANTSAKIHFNTGMLAGYECDLHSYTHSSQKFVLKPLVDENGYDFPSKTNAAFKLAVGDEYVILDINLPTAYKEEAESKLATEAASYFATVCRPQPKYTLTIEPIALKHIVGPSTADTEIFKVGDLINISDPTGGVESATIRIDQFVRNLLDPFDYKLTLTDEITYSQQVRTLIEVDAIKRVVEESRIYDVNRNRRGWKDAEELYNQMFDTEGHYYSEKIAPLSIDTQMLKVGARSQQLVLQNVLFQPNYNADPANLQISAGSLVHYTIAEPDIKTWTMSALSASNVPSTAQYVYAKCARNGTTGTWLVTDQAIIFDSDPSYYHFLVGSLSSVEVVDGVSQPRNFAATYGFTTINGRNITTGVIKSSDGSSVVIDLDAGIIKGNITFESGTTSYNALQSIIGNNTTVQGAVTTANTANTTANTANATANRAEGKIDNLEIGGRNLLINSYIESSKRGNSTELLPALASWASKFVDATNIQKIFKADESYTISFDYEITAIQSGKEFAQKWAGFGLYSVNDGWVAQLWDTQGLNTVGAKAHFSKTFTLLALPADTVMNIYTQRYSDGTNQTIVFSNLKIEKGNKPTAWTPAPEDTEAELAALQADLQNQIDGKIETWSQVADPSSVWTTTALKDKHINDLWYYTGESTETRTNNMTYKYTKSGSTYSWAEYSAGGGDLFDRIDGKAAIFYGSPSGSYEDVEEGDFLVDGATGKTYKYAPTQTPNENGWVNVQDYQTPIATLDLRLDNIDSDTVFSIAEKQVFRNEWFNISGTANTATDGATIVANPAYYNCSLYQAYNGSNATALKSALLTAFNNLRGFLNTCGLYTNEDYPQFNVQTLQNYLATYYTAEAALRDYKEKVGKLVATCSTAASTQTKVIVCPDLTADMLVDADMRITVKFDNANSHNQPNFVFRTTASGSNITPTGLSNSNVYLYFDGKYMNLTGNSVLLRWLSGMEITLLFKDTFSPYQESVAAALKMNDEANFKAISTYSKAMKGSTSIVGGLILTELIQAGNGEAQAGMNGTEGNDVAFWAGGTLAEAIARAAMIVIERTGFAKFGAVQIDGGGTGQLTMPDDEGNSRLAIKNSAVSTPSSADTVKNPNYPDYYSASVAEQTATSVHIDDFGTLTSQHIGGMYTSVHNGMQIMLKEGTLTVTTPSENDYWALALTLYAGDTAYSRFVIKSGYGSQAVQLLDSERRFIFNVNNSNTSRFIDIGLEVMNSAANTKFKIDGLKCKWYHDSSIPKTEIGMDGFGVLIDNTNHFITKEVTVGNQKRLQTTIKGNTDIPGVLWAGRITSGGGKDPYYKNSAKFATDLSVSKSSNSYTITHNLGTTNYAVQITPYSNVTFTITKATDGNSFTVALSSAANFDLTIFGTN